MSRNKVTAAQALSRYIGKITADGEELVNILIGIARSCASPDRIRLEAVDMLMDRFAGKPLAVIEASISQGPSSATVARMQTLDEKQLEALSMLGLDSGLNNSRVDIIDVDPNDKDTATNKDTAEN